MRQKELTEDEYEKRAYYQIIFLGLLSHCIHVVVFALLRLQAAAVYNVASVIFYCVMLFLVRNKHYRTAVVCIHTEVCLFAVVCTLLVGWDSGIALYLLAMCSLTYFCPFRHKWISYIFAGAELCTFLCLKLYTSLKVPGFLAISEMEGLALYVFSAFACFAIMLYGAISANLSAAVSRRELQVENRSLSVLANYDQLTGLLSRHAFLERLEKQGNASKILVMGDIDDFKQINDTWGHHCGDRALSEVAEVIRSQFGQDVPVCRWGGEEFVFAFQNVPPEEAFTRVQALCDAVGSHVFDCGDNTKIHITMTFGVSPNASDISPQKLVEMADARMYEGKARGKNRVQ